VTEAVLFKGELSVTQCKHATIYDELIGSSSVDPAAFVIYRPLARFMKLFQAEVTHGEIFTSFDQ